VPQLVCAIVRMKERTPAHRCLTCRMWAFHVSFESKMRPKHRASVDSGRGTPSRMIRSRTAGTRRRVKMQSVDLVGDK